jgi:hypothetical protein
MRNDNLMILSIVTLFSRVLLTARTSQAEEMATPPNTSVHRDLDF